MFDSSTPAATVKEAIARAPASHPSDWHNWSNVQEAHRQLADDFIRATPAYPPDRFGGRGVVIAGGGNKFIPSVWVTCKLLRRLGCALPVELWHFGWVELDPCIKRLLEPLGVSFVDAWRAAERHPCRILNGWELKPFAVLHSSFREVLFLDADSMPMVDPTFLFDAEEYKRHGAWFTPDRPDPLPPSVWSVFGIPYREEQTFETGQFLVNKETCWRSLNLALHYNEHSDFYYRIVYGDKDTFHLAWRKLGQEYSMTPDWAEYIVHSFLQRWFDGRVVFQHRSGDKWRLDAGNKHYNFAHEDAARTWLMELRRHWSGLWRNDHPDRHGEGGAGPAGWNHLPVPAAGP